MLATLLTVSVCVISCQQSTDEFQPETIIALERGALDRWGRGDPQGFFDIMAPDQTYFDPTTAKRIDGQDALKKYIAPFTGKIHIEKAEMIDPKVQRSGDLAVLTFNLVDYGAQLGDGPKTTARWNSTEVYQRLNGRWKIVHSHWSYVKPALKEETANYAQSLPTIASAVDREISDVEQMAVAAAEAMPEDKFNFSPETLNIRGSVYKGVRTFAEQVKHLAASNYAIWVPLTGEKIPDDFRGGTGPAALKTKVEIMKFLKDSFALGHRGAATLTAENMLQNPAGSRSSRFHTAMFGVTHAYDTYGQMIEYLRMNGIIPPASR
ncbi:MAG TPA: DUF4440 domain-containing protein [Vicinamibacterales bacterium]|nr:DUF4440 domain-containing protein [Vicinamibacterales bacterium]